MGVGEEIDVLTSKAASSKTPEDRIPACDSSVARGLTYGATGFGFSRLIIEYMNLHSPVI